MPIGIDAIRSLSFIEVMHTDRAPNQATVHDALASATRHLLNSRTPQGHWQGRLSSSALSTATALFALARFASANNTPINSDYITRGLDWLIQTQNPDGGWGDTTLSHSNISTTALCWAALTVATPSSAVTTATQAAEQWLTRAAGSLQPAPLASAIAARYGKDRTFSVPILTMCALAGRLGETPTAWRSIPQLPFELAALPQSWFRFFRLPVVSYALPALISMGLARHRNRPTRNPITRLLRWFTTKRVLRVLTTIQPTGGGFLEATPLTSFVVMSLIGSHRPDHPVVQAGVDFLLRSARPDGSWPIDTNLATWVTTLSINALGPTAIAQNLQPHERSALRQWLLSQQYQKIHPYTGAPPGAWAWTDLPGGVPDADDTAGALLALHNLGDIDDQVTRAATQGVQWLLDLQNRDGGIPTFCRGWTNLPFDRSGADLTAHALRAWSIWRDRLPSQFHAPIDTARHRALKYLKTHQRPDGSWIPLWFGNQDSPDEENPLYGTAKVLHALAERPYSATADMIDRATTWLLHAQNPDGGWGGAPNLPSSIEETSLALDALAASPSALEARQRGAAWLIQHTQGGTHFPACPIGFYFAKLWYFEETYPVILSIAALSSLQDLPPELLS